MWDGDAIATLADSAHENQPMNTSPQVFEITTISW